MSLQDNIGHLQAEAVLVREDTSFPDTIRVSTSVVEAPWCVLEAIRPAQLGRQLEQAHWQFFLLSTRRSSQGFRFRPDQCTGASPQENPGES